MEPTSAMEFDVEPAGPCRKKVRVSIPKERVSEEFDKSYRNLVRTVPIPGFRPGKAPRKLVERRFGEQVALEVKQALLDAAFEEAIKKNELSPIADPELDVEEIEVEPEHPLDFEFKITVKPEFDLPDLKGISVAVPPGEPTEEEVDAALLDMRKRKATLRPIEGARVEKGDVVSLKLRGISGEKELLHEENLPYEVGTSWLSGLVAEGLDEALLGKEVGASVKARAFAPPHAEDHPLAGQELELDAEILDHKRPDIPELNGELAKSFDFDSVDELREVVRKEVGAAKVRERDKLIESLALARVVEKCEFDLPEELIEREAGELARRAAYELQMQKRSEEEVAKKVAEIHARRREESAAEMKSFFVLDKIVEKERIIVTENEVREAVAAIAAFNEKAPEQMYALLRDSGRLATLRNQLREKKARERLRKKVTVTDAEPEAAPKKKVSGKKR